MQKITNDKKITESKDILKTFWHNFMHTNLQIGKKRILLQENIIYGNQILECLNRPVFIAEIRQNDKGVNF